MEDASSKPIAMRNLSSRDDNFLVELKKLIAWEAVSDTSVNDFVIQAISDIRERGDVALVEYTNKYDRRNVGAIDELCVSEADIAEAMKSVPAEQLAALEQAAERIRSYHTHQLQESWQYREADGTLLGQQITPIDPVGIYVPGGKAAYPSSVLMNAIPAHVAGVTNIVMVSPAPGGVMNPIVLAAAKIAGVTEIYSVGGAQAIAALACGTESIPKVDKIVGPGNIFVATAKKAVFGAVGLDMVAGPSEILVICDGKTDPDWIAMDLFSQAEHDEEAQSILIGTSAEYLSRVEESINRLLPEMERAEIIRASLTDRGAFVLADDLDEAISISNLIAPEHLELSIEDAESWLPKVKNAGAIFVGRYTPEALGDYCAGPNHVLPTSSTSRFSSPLGVYDFQKRSSIIGCSPEGGARLAGLASVLARGESLTAHARSAEYRGKKD